MMIENLHIHDIGDDGLAVGRHDNQVIFVRNAVPGDVLKVKIFKKKKRFAFAEIVEVVTPSPHRVAPFCQHFGTCGGCKWQYLDYSTQLHYKQKMVTDALQRIGGIAGKEWLPIAPAPHTQYYRNKLEFTFSNKRWLYHHEMDQHDMDTRGLGFHIPGKFDKVLHVSHCHLQDTRSNLIRNFVMQFCVQHDFPFFDIKAQHGLMRNMVIRNTTLDQWMVIVVFFYYDQHRIQLLLNAIRKNFPFITSLYFIINDKKNDSYSDLTPQLFDGLPCITEKLGDFTFEISPKAFFQTNSNQAEALYNRVVEFANLQPHEIVYDLYTGTGTIANYVARKCKKVVGIEYVAEAVNDAKRNSSINDIKNTHFYAGDMKVLLNDDMFALHGLPHVVITDPPRNGMDAAVVAQIVKGRPQRIVYVSCNAATQARDIALLSPLYSLITLQPFDMFPHTHHVESIALLHLSNS